MLWDLRQRSSVNTENYWALSPWYWAPQYYQGLKTINEGIGPGRAAAEIASGKMKRPSPLGNVGLSENTRPRIMFLSLFFASENHQRWKPIAIQKKGRMKAFKLRVRWERARCCVCARTCTGDEKREADIQRDSLGFRRKWCRRLLPRCLYSLQNEILHFLKYAFCIGEAVRATGTHMHYRWACKLLKSLCRTTVCIQWLYLKLWVLIVPTILHPGLSFVYILCIQKGICSLQHCLYQWSLKTI